MKKLGKKKDSRGTEWNLDVIKDWTFERFSKVCRGWKKCEGVSDSDLKKEQRNSTPVRCW